MTLTDIWERLADAGLTGRFVGIAERLKAPAAVDAKIREDARVKGSHPPDLALAGVTDAVRYTLVYPDAGYTAGLQADAERLAALGCELIDRTAGPRARAQTGVTTVWRAPASSSLFEVQFHSPLSHSARERSFPLYERLREPQPGDLERAELAAAHRAIYSSRRGRAAPGPAGPGPGRSGNGSPTTRFVTPAPPPSARPASPAGSSIISGSGTRRSATT